MICPLGLPALDDFVIVPYRVQWPVPVDKQGDSPYTRAHPVTGVIPRPPNSKLKWTRSGLLLGSDPLETHRVVCLGMETIAVFALVDAQAA